MPTFFRNANLARHKLLVLIRSNPNFQHRLYFTACHQYAAQQVTTREQTLKKYGLSDLNLIWPNSVDTSDSIDYIKKNPESIQQMYGKSDLSKLPIFQGGFINFGYWSNTVIDNKRITIDDRIASSKEMYRVMGNLTKIFKQDSLLEVGCGLGYGSTFLSQHYSPKLVFGLDISAEQIARAKKYQASEIASGKLRFTIGEAESMPFTDSCFDSIVSIECAQHFSSMRDFSKEACRILKPDGKLVMTSFFPTTQEGIDALTAIVPNYHIHGSRNTVSDVQDALLNYMEDVRVSSIGENVWHGFSKWLDQIGYHHQWSKIWCALYEKRLIDYVVYQATASKEKLDFREKINSHSC